MTARKTTDAQEQDICARYVAGENTKQMAAVFGVNAATISNILKRNGIDRRTRSEALRGLSSKAEAEVCRRYVDGESTVQLGAEFGVTPSSIGKILKRNGTKCRNLSEAQRSLSPEAEAEVCRRYLAGENTTQLGAAFGVHAATIGKILKRNGTKCRNLSEAQGGLSPKAKAEVCSRYVDGENTKQLGAAFGVSGYTIRAILERNGIKRRSIKEVRGGLSPEAEAEVCSRYVAGENTTQLGAAFGVTRTGICTILERNGIKRRSTSEALGGLSPKTEPEVCHRYVGGENTTQLGAAFGVNAATIGKILKRNGIERRTSGVEFGDSVQHVLDCTGRHTITRECEFYLYELDRYSDTHCKPGIAFDADVRVRVGSGNYGAEILRLVFATRAEAYFLEQAVLDATRGSADCPEDLLDWGGASEIRAMPAEDMVPIVLRLAEELEELGPWAFAAAYCPMTAAQRAICQQRALAGAPACAA
jgi:DNA-directed RNA polymerase specialized sigma24 family protein